jgi:drug/metabolite transporter (DMT)-like permease
MNPHYHWLTEGLELFTFFFIAPALATVIAHKAWQERANPKQYGMRCVASGGVALLLCGVAKWLDADIRSPRYFFAIGLCSSQLSFVWCVSGTFSPCSCACGIGTIQLAQIDQRMPTNGPAQEPTIIHTHTCG